MSFNGTVKKFMHEKGFGFIQNEDGSGDVFFHVSQVNNGESDDLDAGVEMTFDITEDDRSGKTKATNITITGWAEPKAAAGPKVTRTRAPAAPVVAAEPTPADAIKALARASKAFRKSWVAYAKLYGEGVNNPSDHEEDFLTGFADFAAEALTTAMDPNSAKRPAAGEADGEPAAKKKVTIKKAVAETIQRLNKSGDLLAPIRLPAVAGALAQCGEVAALKALKMLEEQAAEVEDPNEFLKNQGSFAAEKNGGEQAEEDPYPW